MTILDYLILNNQDLKNLNIFLISLHKINMINSDCNIVITCLSILFILTILLAKMSLRKDYKKLSGLKSKKIGVIEREIYSENIQSFSICTRESIQNYIHELNKCVSIIESKYNDYEYFIVNIKIKSSESSPENPKSFIKYYASSLSFMLPNIQKSVIVCLDDEIDDVVSNIKNKNTGGVLLYDSEQEIFISISGNSNTENITEKEFRPIYMNNIVEDFISVYLYAYDVKNICNFDDLFQEKKVFLLLNISDEKFSNVSLDMCERSQSKDLNRVSIINTHGKMSKEMIISKFLFILSNINQDYDKLEYMMINY